MFHRILEPPTKNFFLFGARATGKSTWLAQVFKDAKVYNLLQTETLYPLTRDPSLFRKELLSHKKKEIIVLDEIQKCPELLDVVHDWTTHEKIQHQFVITGSSARKLRKKQANFLSGRAFRREFFPLVFPEAMQKNQHSPENALLYGNLPLIVNTLLEDEQTSTQDAFEYLRAYVQTYLYEEIQLEAHVRNLPIFIRFLEVSALLNGQIMNATNIAREVGVSRTTVQSYFEIIRDTLLGYELPAYQMKTSLRQVSHPKFYYFDTGVVRALRGEMQHHLDPSLRGSQLETWMLHELHVYIQYQKLPYKLSYWRTHGGKEIDFILTTEKGNIGIEIKHASTWRESDSKVLNECMQDKKLYRAIGIYLGKRAQKVGDTDVYPVCEFLERLWQGEFTE